MTQDEVVQFGNLYPNFLCIDCGCCTALEYYMLYDDLWERVNPKIKGMLCIGCCEIRLGRILTREDFIDAPINKLSVRDGAIVETMKSHRLIDRLTR